MKTDKPLTSVRDVPPRAWHKKLKQMFTCHSLEWSGDRLSWVVLSDRRGYLYKDGDLVDIEEVILLWPTGLQGIYERDITEIMAEDGKKNRFVVKRGVARRVMDTGWEVDIPCFYFDLIGGNFQAFPIVKNWKGVHDLSMTEVIGNSLQHPDLLKKDTL